MQALNPLKKSKNYAAEINQRLNPLSRGFKTSELESLVKPFHKPIKGVGFILMQARTSELIKIGDNMMMNYYITSIEEFMQNYHLDPKESEIRKRLNKQMGAQRKNNHNACAIILK
jgi:hypothetical protein